MPIRNRDDATPKSRTASNGSFDASSRLIDRPSSEPCLERSWTSSAKLVSSAWLTRATERGYPATGRSPNGSQVLVASRSCTSPSPRSDTNTDTDRVRKSEVVAAAKLIRDDPRRGHAGDAAALQQRSPPASSIGIHPAFRPTSGSGATLTLRRMVVERDLKPRRQPWFSRSPTSTGDTRTSATFSTHSTTPSTSSPSPSSSSPNTRKLFEHAEQQIHRLHRPRGSQAVRPNPVQPANVRLLPLAQGLAQVRGQD